MMNKIEATKSEAMKNLLAAAKAANGLEASFTANNETKQVVTRNLFLAGAAYFNIDRACTADDMLKLVNNNDPAKLKGAQAKSRRNDWQVIRETAHKAADRVPELWPLKDGKPAAGMSRGKFLAACRILRQRPKITPEDMASALKADAEADERTAGDMLKTIVDASIALFKTHPDEFELVRKEAAAIQQRFMKGRKAGELPLRRELAKVTPETEKMVDLSA
jgi:hypothetical protein